MSERRSAGSARGDATHAAAVARSRAFEPAGPAMVPAAGAGPRLPHDFGALSVLAPDPVAARVPAPEPALQAKAGEGSSAGRSLPEETRARMERSFGHDFSDVRVHEGAQAPALGAVAYTRGSDVHFAPGAYDPASRSGRRLLGHELAHVVQQREGRVRATGAVGGVPLNDDRGLEAEADRLGDAAAR